MTVGSLNIALSGLKAAQQQVNLISSNIANATTPGYTRKILPQSNFVVSGETLGVRTLEVRRNVNTALQFDYFAQTSIASSSKVKMAYFDQISAFHGDPNDARSIANNLQNLNNDFVALADNPTSTELLNGTVAHAQNFANRMNDLSSLYTKMRNDAQTEMQDSVSKIENLLQTIVEANRSIVKGLNTGKSTAEAEDARDQAVLDLSTEMDISYYKISDGTLVVQTGDGSSVLADYTARDLVFKPSTIGVTSAYPGSAAGIYIDNPTTANTTQDVNITTKNLGGRLGGLIEMRDEILPSYQAELDEMAQKLSQRFDEQGLRLFTNEAGTIPASVAPPANTNYTGYAAAIQVNQRIIDDPSLLRLGTENETIATGSSQVIDRIVKYTFGTTKGETATGSVNLDNTGTNTLFSTLSLSTSAKVIGVKNIQDLSTLDADTAIKPGMYDTFTIQFGTDPAVDITIGAGDTATDLINTINAAFSPATPASLSATGRLVLNSTQSITIGNGTMTAAGMEVLGLTAGTTAAKNPSFTVQLDDGLVTTIPITSTDTSTQLLAKLNAVPGLHAQLDASGHLSLSTDYGATIKLVDDPDSDPTAGMGIKIASIVQDGFRTDNLGVNGNIKANIAGADSLVSYAQRVVSSQATAGADISNTNSVAETYRATLEAQITNESGVNLDEEMGNLVAMQRVYGANAKMITTSIQMLEELLASI